MALAILMGRSLWLQRAEDRLMYETAAQVVAAAGASTAEQKVTALRDFVRQNVTFHGATYERTSVLRDTASEVLVSGKGYCGEDSRLFICLARAAGVPAQRVNLYGRQPHVVAEVQFIPGRSILVDCQNPPAVAELEPLDAVMSNPKKYGYTDYSTINYERFRLQGVVRRLHLRLGALGWWLESPHLMMAWLYGVLLAVVLAALCARKAYLALRRQRGRRAAAALDAAPSAEGSTG